LFKGLCVFYFSLIMAQSDCCNSEMKVVEGDAWGASSSS
jgi:hypothetical protein